MRPKTLKTFNVPFLFLKQQKKRKFLSVPEISVNSRGIVERKCKSRSSWISVAVIKDDVASRTFSQTAFNKIRVNNYRNNMCVSSQRSELDLHT